MSVKLSTVAVLTAALLSGCNSRSESSTNTVIRDGDPIVPDMKIGLLADTQGFRSTNGGNGTAIAQLTEVLKLYKENDVTHVIAVGDLTDWGSIGQGKIMKTLAIKGLKVNGILTNKAHHLAYL